MSEFTDTFTAEDFAFNDTLFDDILRDMQYDSLGGTDLNVQTFGVSSTAPPSIPSFPSSMAPATPSRGTPGTPARYNEHVQYEIAQDEEQERLILASLSKSGSSTPLAYPPQSSYPGGYYPAPTVYTQSYGGMDPTQTRISPGGTAQYPFMNGSGAPPLPHSSSSNSVYSPSSQSSSTSGLHKRTYPSTHEAMDEDNTANYHHQKVARVSHPLLDFPNNLFQAFNGGDFKLLRNLILQHTAPEVALRTPALDSDVIGQKYLLDFFSALSESHPDAVWVAKKAKFHAESSEITAKIYFAGTRLMCKGNEPRTALEEMTSSYSQYLFHRQGRSLTEEMDLRLFTQPEIDSMMELERSSMSLAVFGKGTVSMTVSRVSEKVQRVQFDWMITSFREAEV